VGPFFFSKLENTDSVGSVVKDPLRAHVYSLIVYKGVQHNPS